MKTFVIEFVSGVEVELNDFDIMSAEDKLLEMGFSSRDIASASIVEKV